MLSDRITSTLTRRLWAGSVISGLAAFASQRTSTKREKVRGGPSIRMHNTPPVVVDGASFEITSEGEIHKLQGTQTWVYPGFGVLMGARVSAVNEKTGSYLPTHAFPCRTGLTISLWLGQAPGSSSGNPPLVIDSQNGDLRVRMERSLVLIHDKHANVRRKFQFSSPAEPGTDWFQVERVRIEGQCLRTFEYPAADGDYCRLMLYNELG